MVKRKIIKIDEDKCDGCELCVEACHEGAIRMVDGKAKLVSDVYCDGLGDCLGECPQGAITIEEREAEAFDAKAVEAHLKKKAAGTADEGAPPKAPAFGGCPGSALRNMAQKPASAASGPAGPSRLGHWPIQLMLVPPGAPFLKGADILVCADCVPFAVPDFHERYLAGKALLVGCPKLDDNDYYEEKLKAIFAEANPRSITVLKMEVPCCTGIAHAAMQARNEAAPGTEIKVHTIAIEGGEMLCEEIDAA
jgi:NAD-dependent dihydropyrimidine dehydrogenase PreA subunit